MGFSVSTDIEIDATADAIWDVLVHTDEYWEWNPMLKWKSGVLSPGSEIRFSLAAGKMSLPVSAVVEVAEPGRELRWTGPAAEWQRPFGRGTHYFKLDAVTEDRVRLTHGEHFSGLAFLPITRGMRRKIESLYGGFNRALKERVEEHYRPA